MESRQCLWWWLVHGTDLGVVQNKWRAGDEQACRRLEITTESSRFEAFSGCKNTENKKVQWLKTQLDSSTLFFTCLINAFNASKIFKVICGVRMPAVGIFVNNPWKKGRLAWRLMFAFFWLLKDCKENEQWDSAHHLHGVGEPPDALCLRRWQELLHTATLHQCVSHSLIIQLILTLNAPLKTELNCFQRRSADKPSITNSLRVWTLRVFTQVCRLVLL